MKTEKDVEYLEEKFPKGETKFRGEAMVLLSLARMQGVKERNTEVKQAIEEIINDIGEDSESWKSHGKEGFNELLQKLGLGDKNEN